MELEPLLFWAATDQPGPSLNWGSSDAPHMSMLKVTAVVLRCSWGSASMQKDYCQQKPTELLQCAVRTAEAALRILIKRDPNIQLERPAVAQWQPTMTQVFLDALGAAISAAGTLLRGTDMVRWAARRDSNKALQLRRT